MIQIITQKKLVKNPISPLYFALQTATIMAQMVIIIKLIIIIIHIT